MLVMVYDFLTVRHILNIFSELCRSDMAYNLSLIQKNGFKLLIFASQLGFGGKLSSFFCVLFVRPQFSHQQWRYNRSTIGLHSWLLLYQVAEVQPSVMRVEQLPEDR